MMGTLDIGPVVVTSSKRWRWSDTWRQGLRSGLCDSLISWWLHCPPVLTVQVALVTMVDVLTRQMWSGQMSWWKRAVSLRRGGHLGVLRSLLSSQSRNFGYQAFKLACGFPLSNLAESIVYRTCNKHSVVVLKYYYVNTDKLIHGSISHNSL